MDNRDVHSGHRMTNASSCIDRRLAAILVADVVGYSRLMGHDEASTWGRLREHRRKLFDALVTEHGGRVVNAVGDGVLCEFTSIIKAVSCAFRIQQGVAAREEETPEHRRIRFRIGINLGDVILEGDDIIGAGVNVAARLQELAEPGGVVVSGAVYDQLQGELRYRFDYLGERRLKNISRPVRVYRLADRKAVAHETGLGPVLPTEGASIAVLPFDNPGGDPEQELLADGVVDELTAALSRMRSLLVIARSTTFTYKHRAVDVRLGGRELGVRYVLQGSVRRSGKRVRVAAQLIEAETAGHVWADHFQGRREDIFDLQDRVTEAVIGAVQPSLRLAEVRRAKRKRADSLDAYDCVMRALPSVWLVDEEANAEALRLLQKAIELDPDYALPKSLAAWCHAQRAVDHWSPPAEERAEALRMAAEAERLDSDDPTVLAVLGAALILARDLVLGSALLEKALLLDPNSAWAWNHSGWLHVFLGRPEVAIEHFRRALRVSPFDPMNFSALIGIGCAHFKAARYEECAIWAAKGVAERPSAVWAHRVLASAYAHLGWLDEARHEVSVLLTAVPDATVSAIVNLLPNDPEYVARFADGLRMAGLPE